MSRAIESGRAGDARLADGHHLARGAAANAFVLIAANFRAVFTFLIARLLGEAGLGRFSLMFATVDTLSKIGMLGLDQAVVPMIARREAAADREGSRQVFLRAVAAGAVASLILTVVAWPVLAWLGRVRHLEEFSRGGTVMLLALPGIAVARISTGVSRSLLSMRSEFYSRGLGETWITSGVFIIAIGLGFREVAPSLAVAAGSLGGACIAFALAAETLAARQRVPAANAAGVSIGKMLRFSVPIAGSSLLNTLALRVDVLLLGAFVGRAPGVSLESFGVFCAAAEVAGGLRKVRQVFDPIFAPVAATRHIAGSGLGLRDTVAGPGRWVLAGQLPLVGFLILAGGSILSIYGPGFRAGALWLALLAAAHAANSFAGLAETLLMIERPLLNFLNASVTVSIQVVVGLLLIPRFGVMGAVVGMGAGFAVQGLLRFVELKHVFGWAWPWRSLARPLAAFSMAFAPAIALRASLGSRAALVSGVLFLALYVTAWVILGADPDDRVIWRRLLKRA